MSASPDGGWFALRASTSLACSSMTSLRVSTPMTRGYESAATNRCLNPMVRKRLYARPTCASRPTTNGCRCMNGRKSNELAISTGEETNPSWSSGGALNGVSVSRAMALLGGDVRREDADSVLQQLDQPRAGDQTVELEGGVALGGRVGRDGEGAVSAPREHVEDVRHRHDRLEGHEYVSAGHHLLHAELLGGLERLALDGGELVLDEERRPARVDDRVVDAVEDVVPDPLRAEDGEHDGHDELQTPGGLHHQHRDGDGHAGRAAERARRAHHRVRVQRGPDGGDLEGGEDGAHRAAAYLAIRGADGEGGDEEAHGAAGAEGPHHEEVHHEVVGGEREPVEEVVALGALELAEVDEELEGGGEGGEEQLAHDGELGGLGAEPLLVVLVADLGEVRDLALLGALAEIVRAGRILEGGKGRGRG
eukprot:556177-Prorocentrum_minimum.AAC.1